MRPIGLGLKKDTASLKKLARHLPYCVFCVLHCLFFKPNARGIIRLCLTLIPRRQSRHRSRYSALRTKHKFASNLKNHAYKIPGLCFFTPVKFSYVLTRALLNSFSCRHAEEFLLSILSLLTVTARSWSRHPELDSGSGWRLWAAETLALRRFYILTPWLYFFHRLITHPVNSRSVTAPCYSSPSEFPLIFFILTSSILPH